MTQFSDLVTRAWMHAKNSDGLYLAGWDQYAVEGGAPIFSCEPTAYNDAFIMGIEKTTGLRFERVLLSERQQLEIEYDSLAAAIQRTESINYLTDEARRMLSRTIDQYHMVRRALDMLDDQEAETARDNGQFGVGA